MNGSLKAEAWTIFNFRLSNGMCTDYKNKLDTNSVLVECNPPTAVIKLIRILYKAESKHNPGGSLVDYALYDTNSKLLMKTNTFN